MALTQARVNDIIEEYVAQYDGRVQQALTTSREAVETINNRTSEITTYLAASRAETETLRTQVESITGRTGEIMQHLETSQARSGRSRSMLDDSQVKHAAMDTRATALTLDIQAEFGKDAIEITREPCTQPLDCPCSRG